MPIVRCTAVFYQDPSHQLRCHSYHFHKGPVDQGYCQYTINECTLKLANFTTLIRNSIPDTGLVKFTWTAQKPSHLWLTTKITKHLVKSALIKLKTNKIWPQGGQVCMWNYPRILCQQKKSLRCLIKLIKLMKKNLTTLRLKSWFSIHSNRNRWQLWNINTVLIAWYTNNTKVITLP